jgi:GGDEF domain-containing protein
MNENSSQSYALDLDHSIALFVKGHAQFSQYIDRHWHDLRIRELAGCLAVHARNAVCLARVLRDRIALGLRSPPPADIDLAIEDVQRKLGRLDRTIDEYWVDELDDRVCRLLNVYSQNAVRLGRLMVHRQALLQHAFQDDVDELGLAFDQALRELGDQWEIEL